MGMEVNNFRETRQQTTGQIPCLEQMFESTQVPGSTKTLTCLGKGGKKLFWSANRQHSCGKKEPWKIFKQLCGQVVHPGLNFFSNGMGKTFPGVTHGKNMDRNPQLFQAIDLIGDEGFGYPRVPFEDHTQGGQWRTGSG